MKSSAPDDRSPASIGTLSMKILFTKNEYRTLLDMIYLAEWMLTSYDEKPDAAKAKYEHLAQKIYSHAKEMGWDTLVASSPADNKYVPTKDYEEKSGVYEFIDDYETESFWDQLIDRMTERDVADKMGDEEVARLSNAAYEAIANPIADKYAQEFADNGVDRLHVNEEEPPR